MKEIIGLITVFLAFIGFMPYLKDLFSNKIKPHIFSWVIWSIATSLAFLAQWLKGGGPGAWTTGITALISILITILSLKRGTKDITLTDKLFFVTCLFAIIPWYLTKDPTLSVIIITVVDVLAFFPTIRKTFNDSKSETFSTYAINIVRHGLSIAALINYSIATVLFPAALTLMNVIMVGVMMRPKFSPKKKA